MDFYYQVLRIGKFNLRTLEWDTIMWGCTIITHKRSAGWNGMLTVIILPLVVMTIKCSSILRKLVCLLWENHTRPLSKPLHGQINHIIFLPLALELLTAAFAYGTFPKNHYFNSVIRILKYVIWYSQKSQTKSLRAMAFLKMKSIFGH